MHSPFAHVGANLVNVGQNRVVDPSLIARLLAADPAELGRSLKSLRVSRNLTQGELAAGIVSVGFISRIEAGKRRADLRVLEALLQRLGANLEELLGSPSTVREMPEHELTVDHAELHLRTGDAAAALRQVESVLDANVGGPEALLRRARNVRAGCLEALGRRDEAIIELEDLCEGDPEDVEWIRAGIALSRCHRETGDLAQAIGSGQRVLDRLIGAGLDGTDEAIQLTVTIAAAHFERGDINFAIRQCQRALKRADEAGSPAARAAAYWNVSVMESERGNMAVAVPMARRAIQALESSNDARNIARLRSQLGIFELRQDPPDVTSARENLHAAEEMMRWSAASVVDRARNDLALARADLVEGDLLSAAQRATRIVEVGEDAGATVVVEARVVLGQIAMRTGDPVAARRHFQEAVARLTIMGADRSAAQLWFDLGNLLETAGDADGARDAYRRAAASTGLTHRVTRPSSLSAS